MNIEQLIEFCKENNIDFVCNARIQQVKDEWSKQNWLKSNQQRGLKDYDVYIEWTTGGAEGGNCWGGEAEPFYSNEKEPDLEDLDKILAHFAPNLTFLQYRKLAEEIIEYEGYTDYEYYGNYYEKSVKKFNLLKLVEKLNELD